MNTAYKIRRADMSDIPELAQLLSAAFQHDPVSSWLMPDPHDRQARHPDFFRIFVQYALDWGEVHTTDEYEGVALWLDVDPDSGSQSGSEATGPLRAALAPNYEQSTHPTHLRHVFLPFIGVLPEEPGQGIGRALMLHKLMDLDEVRVPVYLDASSIRSREFYERLGFRRLPARISYISVYLLQDQLCGMHRICRVVDRAFLRQLVITPVPSRPDRLGFGTLTFSRQASVRPAPGVYSAGRGLQWTDQG